MITLEQLLESGTKDIDILGEPWVLKVENQPDDVVPLAQNGECDYHHKYIFVWKTGYFQQDVDSLIHELLHAGRMVLGIESRGSSVVENIAAHEVINPVSFVLGYVLANNGEVR